MTEFATYPDFCFQRGVFQGYLSANIQPSDRCLACSVCVHVYGYYHFQGQTNGKTVFEIQARDKTFTLREINHSANDCRVSAIRISMLSVIINSANP